MSLATFPLVFHGGPCRSEPERFRSKHEGFRCLKSKFIIMGLQTLELGPMGFRSMLFPKWNRSREIPGLTQWLSLSPRYPVEESYGDKESKAKANDFDVGKCLR